MALIDTLVVFVISLLVGATGIYIGARVVTDTNDFTYAIITALIASIVWAGVALLLGWIPFLGPLVALVAYLGVINWRYPGGCCAPLESRSSRGWPRCSSSMHSQSSVSSPPTPSALSAREDGGDETGASSRQRST